MLDLPGLDRPGVARVALAMALLLGACATDVPPPTPPPPAQATSAQATSAPAAAPHASVADTSKIDAIAPGAGAGNTPSEAAGAEPGRSPLAVPDDQVAASAVAARPAGTEVGYLLLDLDTGFQLAALNPDLPLIPASTAKLATAVVALDVLGPDYRYRTELLADGVVSGGVLAGDLILRGSGDPFLDVADLLELAMRLEMAGVRRVAGRFLIDDSALPLLSEIEPSQPLEAAYNPSIGALSLAFNRVRVAWQGGGRVVAATVPPLHEARFEAAAPAGLPAGGVALKDQGGEAVVWQIADRGRRRQEASLPVKDPGLHAGHVFHRLARAQGITLALPARATTPAAAKVLASHESAPLRFLLRNMLVYSNNMMAELIGLSVAQRLSNQPVDLETAGALLVAHLDRLIPEVDWTGAVLGNHSGLDGQSRLTARQLAAIARYGWRTQALPALLPAAGWSGTLAERFDQGDEALRVWAKTGTVNYGSALAGYLFPTSDRPAVFVTLVSDMAARAAYDAALKPDSALEQTAHAWNQKARKLQDDLVEAWLVPLPTS